MRGLTLTEEEGLEENRGLGCGEKQQSSVVLPNQTLLLPGLNFEPCGLCSWILGRIWDYGYSERAGVCMWSPRKLGQGHTVPGGSGMLICS